MPDTSSHADPKPQGIRFREDFGCWWPNYDHAPEKCFAFVQHGLADMDIASSLCRRHDVCVQAGAHAGLWPRRLAGIFQIVHAFEPDPPLYECARRNLSGIENVSLAKAALGSSTKRAALGQRASAGSARIEVDGAIPVDMITIDSLDLAECDAIYLDVEGYEVEALLGAAGTITGYRPILHVEELPRAKDGIAAHMRSIGYRLHRAVHKDCIYVPC